MAWWCDIFYGDPITNPFDTLRPFKNQPEAFTPRDTLPWERLALNLVQSGLPASGLGCISPIAVVEEQVAWLGEHLKLPPGAAILDLGCGPGHYSHRLAQQGYQVTGVDLAQPFITIARTVAERDRLPCTFYTCSLFDLPLSQAYDAILLINSVLKQLTLTEFESLLKQLKPLLKVGGAVIAEVSLRPNGFEQQEPTVQEDLSLHQYSPWSDRVHAWLRRELTFPASNERVSHHLILEEGASIEEYWSRFVLHPPVVLATMLTQHQFKVKDIFGPTLGRTYTGSGMTGFIWWRC